VSENLRNPRKFLHYNWTVMSQPAALEEKPAFLSGIAAAIEAVSYWGRLEISRSMEDPSSG